MRLVWYFARLNLGSVLLTLASLIVLVVAVTLVENAGTLSTLDEGGNTAMLLAFYSAVERGYDVLPVAWPSLVMSSSDIIPGTPSSDEPMPSLSMPLMESEGASSPQALSQPVSRIRLQILLAGRAIPHVHVRVASFQLGQQFSRLGIES